MQMLSRTPAGFSVAQSLCKQWTELDTPLEEGLAADLNVALVRQFLHVPVAQGKAKVQPNRVLNSRHRETVAVRFRVSHARSAYLDPVKAT